MRIEPLGLRPVADQQDALLGSNIRGALSPAACRQQASDKGKAEKAKRFCKGGFRHCQIMVKIRAHNNGQIFHAHTTLPKARMQTAAIQACTRGYPRAEPAIR
ncbi:hypothetical protein GCM10009127_19290 [Alteraurantiacibacter aestuarii]